MVVNGMTEEELMREFKLDLMNAYSRYLKTEAKFRRTVVKSKNFPIKTYIKYNSPRKNRWIITSEAHNRKMVDKKALMAYAILQNTDSGIYVTLMIKVNEVLRFHFFTPHFFSRYAERSNLDKIGEDLITHFLQHNGSLSYLTINNTTVEGSSEDGVALGLVTEHGNYLFRTFITRDLAKGSQIEDFKSLEAFRSKINKK